MIESEAIKKAIKHFECMKNDAVVVLDSGFGTHLGESDLVYRNRKMYAELAINALEKQIEKKPYHISQVDDNDNANVECPVCHAITDYAVNIIKRGYCWKCGQLLDWSDEE